MLSVQLKLKQDLLYKVLTTAVTIFVFVVQTWLSVVHFLSFLNGTDFEAN